MKVLGLCASHRHWGNTEILVRQALAGAGEEGADTRFLRLSDYEMRPCTGCMTCVLKDRDCVLRDDLPVVLEAMRWADAMVLGSPAYILGAAAAVKVLQERLLRFSSFHREFAGKPGLAIGAAGMSSYAPFALPQIALTFLCLGMPIVDQLMGYGQGPGEVFWDPASLDRAFAGGRALGRGEGRYRGEAGACPSCHFNLVTVSGEGKGSCPLCDLSGTWSLEPGGARFAPDDGAEPRWSETRVSRHFKEGLLPSGPRFRARKDEIRAKVLEMKSRDQNEGVIHD